MSNATYPLAAELGRELVRRSVKVATAESCTGGLIAGAITDVPGSSDWFERGVVTYSNSAKIDLLGVRPETLRSEGAVSEAVAREMADGMIAHSAAELAVAVTGVAGPAGGTAQKPVGMVCLGFARRGRPAESETRRFPGDRAAVREATVVAAIEGLLARIRAG